MIYKEVQVLENQQKDAQTRFRSQNGTAGSKSYSWWCWWWFH